MIDINFCYLNDALGKEFKPEEYDGENDMVGNEKYQDPDATSIKLYTDLRDIWSKQYFDFDVCCWNKYNLVDQFGRRYSSDWIGPSRCWAKVVGMTNLEIGQYLKVARTIGGHILWPVHRIPTLNTARAGAKSLYDRIDLTLYEIQQYYLNKPVFFSVSLRNQIEKEAWFFDIFKVSETNLMDNFKGFIDFWKCNSFVDCNYQVLSLANSDFEKGRYITITPKETIFPGNSQGINVFANKTFSEKERKILLPAFKKYSKNNVLAIQKRNELIL